MKAILMRTGQLWLAVLCLCALPTQAQGAPSEGASPLVTSMTLESFQQRVQALGFSTVRGTNDGKQDAFFTFLAEGRKLGGITLGPSAIELFISYKDGAKQEDLNEWNRVHFGNAAFVDQNGNAVLRSELILDGGVSEQNVAAFVTRFRDAAGAYAHFIADHKKKP